MTAYVQPHASVEVAGHRVSTLRSDAPLCLRATRSGRPSPFGDAVEVHLVASGAGPLAGDHWRLDIRVADGCGLVVRDVAATLLLPGVPGAESAFDIDVTVGENACFAWLPEPVIAATGCRHRGRLTVRLGAGAQLLLRETIVLGRHHEPSGTLRQRTRVTLDDRPLYDQEISAGPGGVAGWSGPAVTAGHKVIGSSLIVDPRDSTAVIPEPGTCGTCGTCAVMPLAGPGLLVTALAPDAASLPGVLEQHAARCMPVSCGT